MSAKAGSIGGIILGVVIAIAAIWFPPAAAGAWFYAGAFLGSASLIAGGVLGLVFSPKSFTPEAAKASDMKFSSASEGIPVPVVFGECKVVPNFMNWEASQFYSTPITSKQGGKGGGGAGQVTGYNYFLTFELGLCMGPIDEIGQVVSVPGDILMRGNIYQTVNTNIASNNITASQSGNVVTASNDVFDASMVGSEIIFANSVTAIISLFVDSQNVQVTISQTVAAQFFQLYIVPPQITFLSGDTAEVNLQGSFAGKNNQSVTEGGLVRIYRGSATQTRIASGDPYVTTSTYSYTYIDAAGNKRTGTRTTDFGFNYRNICWALHMKFQIGQQTPTPKTYQYIIRRTPRCVRDDNTTVSGLLTRGSTDSTRAEYNQANPAAIIYEILTNQLWGRGVSSDFIDEDSFIATSIYFAGKNLGMSFLMDSPDKMVNFLDGIRHHLKTILSWKNGKWTIRCLLDPAVVAADIQTLTSNEIEGLKVTRSLWPSTVNDIRVEFTNRMKLYKPDTVHVQDSANMELTGRINSQHVPLIGFTEWNQATKQAWRIMRESSYPLMACEFYMNRFKSSLEIGDCFRLIWKEWSGTTITAYFDVTKIEPQGKDDDRLKITAVEDVFFCPVAGEESSITLPTEQVWEKVRVIDDNDLYFFGTIFDPNLTNKVGIIFPVLAFEAPAIYTRGQKQIVLVMGQVPSPDVTNMQVYAGQVVTMKPGKSLAQSKEQFVQLTGVPLFGVGGQLLTNITNTFKATDRSAVGLFDFSIANPVKDESTILGVNQVVDATDDLETLANSLNDWLIIGEEIMQIGYIEKISSNLYRAHNVIRGCFGTPIAPHSTNDTIFYVQQFGGAGYDSKALGLNAATIFRVYPMTSSGVSTRGQDFKIYHPSQLNEKYLGLGILPLTPSAVAISSYSGGTLLQVTIRPRFYNCGIGTAPIFGAYNSDTDLMAGEIRNLVVGLEGMSFFCLLYDSAGLLMNKIIPLESQITFKPDAFDDPLAGTVSIAGLSAIPITLPPVAAIGTFTIIDSATKTQINSKKLTVAGIIYQFGTTRVPISSNLSDTVLALVIAINRDSFKTKVQAISPPIHDAIANTYIIQIVAVNAGTGGNSITISTDFSSGIASVSGSHLAGGLSSRVTGSVKKVEVYAKIGQQSSIRAAVLTL